MTSKNVKPNENEIKSLLSFYQRKQFLEAEKLALSLIRNYPKHPYAWKIFAAVLEQTDRIAEAIEINQKVVFLTDSDHEAHLSLGNCLNRLGKLEEAALSYKKALSLKPHYMQALNNLGIILNKLKKYQESLSCFEKIIALQPDSAHAYSQLSLNLFSLGRLEEAVFNLKKVINLQPNNYLAYSNLGNILVELGQFDEALLICQKGIDIKPDFPKLFFHLGNAQRGLGQYQLAITNFKTAIRIKPDYSEAYNNLGITLTASGQIEEAVTYYKKSINLNPEFFGAYSNLGIALMTLGKFEESNNYFQKSVYIKPDYAEAYNNWGRALMYNFDFKKAFELMEWRLQLDEKNYIPLNTSKPRWDGLTKQRVFVWKEQGIGDHIMFSSMISELHASVEKVIVECDPRLLPLFQRSFPHDIQFITDRAEISEDDYDSHLPIGSLPLHFRQELNDFKKSSQGWLQADPARVQNIRQHITQNNQKKVVGISWKTSSLISNAYLRNIKIEKFLNSFKESELIFVNLQYGGVSEEISNLKVNHGIEVLEIPDLDLFNDIDGLAALISACDYVVSIDNLNPHLAGALKIKAKLLLIYAADERWGYKTSKSFWYDSIDIYRQTEPENWNDPILNITNDLEMLINK